MTHDKSASPAMRWLKIVVLTPLFFGLGMAGLVMLIIGGVNHKVLVAVGGAVIIVGFLEWFTLVVVRACRTKGSAVPLTQIVMLHALMLGLVGFFLWKATSGT